MGQAAEKLSFPDHNSDANSSDAESLDIIKSSYTPELVLVLCGQLGASSSTVASILKEILEKDFGYEKCEVIKLSKFILNNKHRVDYSTPPPKATSSKRFNDIKEKIDIGNMLRDKFGHSILADFAIHYISQDRQRYEIEKIKKRTPEKIFTQEEISKLIDDLGIEELSTDRRVAYVIDSVKNEDELKLLKLIYRDILYFIGVSAPIDIRTNNFLNAIDGKEKMNSVEIAELINRDSGEEVPHGQKVNKIIPLADFFLDVDPQDYKKIRQKLLRFIDLIFGTGIVTPTSSETAMYLATSVAGNSACLSRQVGAVVTDEKGEILGVGWNDVPKFGGGLYDGSEKDENGESLDKRCMNLRDGLCFNDYEKKIITEQIANSIQELIRPDISFDQLTTKIKSSNISNLIEFSRAIHAEMHAIITASQKTGERVKNGKLFCTTYPCHNCARHIITAGIKEVYYIEPYRKSLTIKLHGDAITEERGNKENMVTLLPFDGIGPNKYLQLFDMIPDSRKKNGVMRKKNRIEAKPKMSISLSAIPFLEARIFQEVESKLK